MSQLQNKPVTVHSSKLLTAKQIAMEKNVGVKIAVASRNGGTGTVESHCANTLVLSKSNVEITINELQSQIEKLSQENRILLATIGLLTKQSTDKPLPIPVTNKPVSDKPVVVHDRNYCDESMRTRFAAVVQKVEIERIAYNPRRYKQGPYACYAAYSLAGFLGLNTARLESFRVEQLIACEEAYNIR